jgi:hypothetical protein
LENGYIRELLFQKKCKEILMSKYLKNDNMETIIDSKGYRYMRQFMTDLPDNVMMNKVLTGCGGTTVALSNDIPYVICVPFRAMILNKMKWGDANNMKLCPVMGGVSDDFIKNFRGKKYMVTYDSLERLCNFIDPSKFKILIDESHKLIAAGAFRGNAIRTVIDNFPRFKSYVFMTATPVKDKYQLHILTGIPKVTINWYNIEPIDIKYNADVTNISQTVSFVAAKHLTGEIESNAHIFINSVTSIIDIIETIDHGLISPEVINVMCANNEENQEKLNATIGENFKIKDVGEVNKVNFYTSTAFEGSDIFDTDGKIYIVTDGKKDYTKNDILTTLPQIIGRIRDTKYKNKIDLIFTPSPFYNYTSEYEFETFVKESLSFAGDLVETYNNAVNPMLKTALYKDAETNRYILQRNGTLILNETALYNEMHSFESLHNTYYAFRDDNNDGRFTINANGTDHNYSQQAALKIEGADKLLIRKKPNFGKLCIEYLSENCSKETKLRIDICEPIIRRAYEVLGADKMRALRFEKKLIKNELIRVDILRNKDRKIVDILNYRVGQFITSLKIRGDLSNTYGLLGIQKLAKTSDLRNWYEVKDFVKWNKDTSTSERGLVITGCKIHM